jgi:guanine deaminase
MDLKERLPDYYAENSVEESLEATKKLIDFISCLYPRSEHVRMGTAEPLVQPILTPRYALSCTDELQRKIGLFADEYDGQQLGPRMRIQTHIAENVDEVNEVHKVYGQSYAEAYDTRGLLRDTTILGHAIHLTDSEIDLIKKRNAGIAHCPTSNFYLSSGVAPIGKYLDKGLKVCLLY